jgi:hypothetical protein
VLLAAGLAAAGCTSTQTVGAPGPSTTTTVAHTPKGRATKVILRGFHTLRAGQSGEIIAAHGAEMKIKASIPKASTTRLSPSYGYSPQHGYYVTFRISVANTGSQQLVIERLDFWVNTPGLGKVTTNSGNAPFSGSPTQLDTTLLTPGQKVSNNLTFDVSHPSGTLVYGPGGKPSVAWRFSA